MIRKQKLRKLSRLIHKKEVLIAKIRSVEVSLYLEANDDEIARCRELIMICTDREKE